MKLQCGVEMRRTDALRIGTAYVLGLLIAALGLIAPRTDIHAAPAANTASQERLAGVWRIERPILAVRTVDGKEPPLKPEAAAVYRQRIEARKRGDRSFDSATWCASVGMPRMMWINYPFEIMVSPQHITFLHEWNWWARIVYLGDALAAPAATPGAPESPLENTVLPVPMGLSKGHWEGETLVVQTTELLNSTLLDSAGMPHSGQLKLIERIRLRSPDVLEDRIRIEDPATFTQPWETVVTYRRQRNTDIQEDVCLDRIKAGAAAVKEE